MRSISPRGTATCEISTTAWSPSTAGVDADASDALLTDLLTAVDGDQAVVLISHVAVPAGLVDRTVRLEAGRLHA